MATRCRIVIGVLAGAMLALPVTAAAATTTGTVLQSDSVACPTTTVCYTTAGRKPPGRTLAGIQAGVQTVVNGRETAFRVIKPAFAMSGISCPTSGFCLAVGTTFAFRGILVQVSHGRVTKERQLPWEPDYVDCPSADHCVIVGQTTAYRNHTIKAAVVDGTTVTRSSTHRFSSKEAAASALSCASVSACELAGETQPGAHYFFENIGANAKLGTPHFSQLLNTDNTVGIACPLGQSTCYLTGINHSPGAAVGALYSATIGGSTLAQVSTFAAELFHLSCLTLTHCTGGGIGPPELGPVAPHPAVVTFTNGQPGPVEQFPGLPTAGYGGGFVGVDTTSANTWVGIAESSQKSKTAFIRGTTS